MSDSEQRPRILYTAEATVTGGRRGHGATSNGSLEVTFTSPAELGGDGAPGTNPEQLFALGYGACWQNAMIGIARRKGLDVTDSIVTARVRHRTGRERPSRPRGGADHHASLAHGPRGRGSAHRRGGAALPVFQRGAGQCRGDPHPALTGDGQQVGHAPVALGSGRVSG